MSETIDSSLNTLSPAFIALGADKRDRKLTDLARAIHWSLPTENLNACPEEFNNRSDKRTKGVRVEQSKDQVLMMYIPNSRSIFDYKGKELIIDGILFPGIGYGKEIFEAIDEAHDHLEWNRLGEGLKFLFSSYFLSFFSTAHSFIDGTGRVSVAVAKLLIERHTDKSLNLEELLKRNGELLQSMKSCSAWMLPEKENPAQLTRQVETSRTIAIQDYSYEEKNDFVYRYSKSLIQTIHCVRDLKPPENKGLQAAEIQLANLLKDCSHQKA